MLVCKTAGIDSWIVYNAVCSGKEEKKSLDITLTYILKNL